MKESNKIKSAAKPLAPDLIRGHFPSILNPLFTIIVVNYNTADITKACIESVLTQQGVSFEIIVVDNASKDHSVETLKTFGDRIHFIQSDINLGFGKANNLAAKKATGDYLLLLNPDAFLNQKDDLQKILVYMKDHPQYGLVGLKIMSLDGSTETKPKAHYPGEKYIGFPYQNLSGNIAWVLGACMVLPREIYTQIKGFDEDFFLYAEDADICLRVRKAGYEIGYYPEVEITHIGSASERTTGWYELTMKKRKALYLFDKKHYSKTDVDYLVKFNLRRARLKVFQNRLMAILTFGLSKKPRDEKYKAQYDFYLSKSQD